MTLQTYLEAAKIHTDQHELTTIAKARQIETKANHMMKIFKLAFDFGGGRDEERWNIAIKSVDGLPPPLAISLQKTTSQFQRVQPVHQPDPFVEQQMGP